MFEMEYLFRKAIIREPFSNQSSLAKSMDLGDINSALAKAGTAILYVIIAVILLKSCV